MRLMNMSDSGRRPVSLRDAVYVGIISFLTPIVAQHNGLIPEKEKAPAPIEQAIDPVAQIESMIQSYFQQIESNPHLEESQEMSITWLDSPVTQEWEYDYQKEYWTTKQKHSESFRSPPSIRIGLREDGVVIWKKIVTTQ